MDEGEIIDVEGKGKMLIQSVGKTKIVLMGKKRASSKIEAIVSIEIDKKNLLKQGEKKVLKEPYEESKTFNLGRQKLHYACMNDYLQGRGVY